MDIDVICKFRNKSNFIVKKFKNKKVISTKYNKKSFKYNFNDVWDNNMSFDNIYSYMNDNSTNYKDKNIILFGYSGSGKTYTMINILKQIINDYINKNITYKLTCFQIYKNTIFDVLNNNNELKYFKNDKLLVKNPTKIQFQSFDDLEKIINENRKNNKTDSNDISSRSCLIIKINSIVGNFNIIDMPGQEIGNVNNNNIVNNEAKNINLNMLALKQCILSYYQKNKYIPFRNSLLTLYLKKMFISVCKVYFICTINAEHNFYHQLDSMKYASCLVHPKKNLDNDIQKLLLEYSLYITDISLNNTEDNEIHREIRKNDLTNIHKIGKLLKSNSDTIIAFQKKYDNFMNKLKN